MDKTPILAHITKFVELNQKEERLILDAFDVKTYLRNEYLLESGAISKYEFFVLEGCLRIHSLDIGGNEHTISFHTEGFWLGDLRSFIDKQPASYNIQALESSTVLAIKRDSWYSLLDSVPVIEKYFRLMLQNGLCAMQERILQIISTNAEQRFLELEDKRPELLNRVSQKVIASYLGITPEFLSVLRKRMALS